MYSDAVERSAMSLLGDVNAAKEPVNTPIVQPKSYREQILERLRSNGWLESVAGVDFKTAVDGLEKALKLKLGIIISGDYGCGKTSFVTAIGNYSERINCTIPEQVKYLDFEDYPDFVTGMMNKNVFIDDFGAENIINKYGVKQDLVGDFICRYHLYGKGKLFITTNLHGQEIIDKKGGRVYSRLKDLCVPIKFVGKDKREWDL